MFEGEYVKISKICQYATGLLIGPVPEHVKQLFHNVVLLGQAIPPGEEVLTYPDAIDTLEQMIEAENERDDSDPLDGVFKDYW
ncbi:hypothetical protein M446_3873 [Methylobacterium sp. 4-46]|nr:hypothetical protein M446_3873 [Methylobacterium sp. 4-46]